MERRSPEHEAAAMIAQDCIAVRVRLINRVLSSVYDEALRPFGLRISQVNILAAVAHMVQARPSSLSRVLKIEKSTLSRDLVLMKTRGWLESDPPAGGRNQTICVTRAGAEILTRVLPAWKKAQAEATRLIGDDGEAALSRLAARLGFGKPTN
jgi:DNA-binding MarR family transcriptional regulator